MLPVDPLFQHPASQAIKRAIRREFATANLLSPEHRAVRTKRLLAAAAERLVTNGRDAQEAEAAVTATLSALGIDVVKTDTGEVDYDDVAARHNHFAYM